MLHLAATALLVAVALYFIALGLLALARPAIAGRFLLGFADSANKHYAELAARLLAGGAMLVAGPTSAHPAAMATFGWLLVGSTSVMALIPWQLHDRFARAAVPRALRYLPLIGVGSLALGVWLAWNVSMARVA